MKKPIANLNFIFGSFESLDKLAKVHALSIFSPIVCEFWSEVSSGLLGDNAAKTYSDVISFAFYCRKASLKKLQLDYTVDENRIGRGVVFHVAPSNVPVNYAYSLLAGMLSGNSNIVRLPSVDFEQVAIINKYISLVLEKDRFRELREMICLVQYGHDDEINKFLSGIVDIRVIWGGDNSISAIRKAPLAARAYDITFADRFSLALLHANSVLGLERLDKLAEDFFNDTYLFDQNACSSPRLIVWQGDDAASIFEAKRLFWAAVERCLHDYLIDEVTVVDKLTTLCVHASDITKPRLVSSSTNKLWRIEIESLDSELSLHSSHSGYFLEYVSDDLQELAEITNRKFQTLSYFGYEKEDIRKLLLDLRLLGIDRAVPIGATSEFSLTWDGFDLIRTMSRVISIK